MSRKAVALSADEMAIIAMIRRFSFQEIVIQVQDSVVTSVNQILKHRRKKGGGLVFAQAQPVGLQPGLPVQLTPDEAAIISKLREKPFQQIDVHLKNGRLEAMSQTIKIKNHLVQ